MTQVTGNQRKAFSTFSEREIERLRWYRSAVRAGFYTDQCTACHARPWVARLLAECTASAKPNVTPKGLAPALASRARAEGQATVV